MVQLSSKFQMQEQSSLDDLKQRKSRFVLKSSKMRNFEGVSKGMPSPHKSSFHVSQSAQSLAKYDERPYNSSKSSATMDNRTTMVRIRGKRFDAITQ